MPSPQRARLQLLRHIAPGRSLFCAPTSHASPISTRPLPHTGFHACGARDAWDWAEATGGGVSCRLNTGLATDETADACCHCGAVQFTCGCSRAADDDETVGLTGGTDEKTDDAMGAAVCVSREDACWVTAATDDAAGNFAQSDGVPAQIHPTSNWQDDEQPSPAAAFLSSHASPLSLIPLPHDAAGAADATATATDDCCLGAEDTDIVTLGATDNTEAGAEEAGLGTDDTEDTTGAATDDAAPPFRVH